MQTTEENGKRYVMLQWSHIVILALANLLAVGTLYGTMRAQVDEAQRNIQELKAGKVEQKQFDELRDDIIRRLDRIESKVDRDKLLREIH